MTINAIDVSNAVKSFGRSRALTGLNLQVAPGEVHAFLGPNGAGKSTTLRALTGLLKLDSGQATVAGLDCWSQSVHVARQLSYVPGHVALWPELTGNQTIHLLTHAHGGAEPSRVAALIEAFELQGQVKARAYSQGNRQKVALIAALARDVPVYLFDEPTTGLDPLMEEVFRDQIRALRSQGKTVLLSTHILSEAQELADRVTIIRAGACVQTGALADLRELGGTVLSAEFDTAELARAVGAQAQALPGVTAVQIVDCAMHCRVDQTSLGDLTAVVAAARPRALRCDRASLEDVFMHHYGTGTHA